MKKSFSTFSEVAHIWAQQLPEQGEAYCKQGRFDKKILYSYSAKIGMFLTDDVVVISRYSFSSNTWKHIGEAVSACSHKTVLSYPYWIPYHCNLQEMVNYIGEVINKMNRCYISNYREQKYWESELQEYLKVDPTIIVPELKFCMTEEEVKKINDRANKAAETRNANAKVDDDPEK